MNAIVVYKSSTGFTAQYARWIAQSLHCEAKPLNQVDKSALSRYDTVIYGGWLMGGSISGLQKLQKLCPKPAAVFAVGAAPETASETERYRKQNKLEDIPFFYMQGGIRYEKMGLIHRVMLKTVRKVMAKQGETDEQSRFMAKALESSFDCANQNATTALIEAVKDR